MNRITGQVIFLGPTMPGLGLQHGTIFYDGIFETLYPWIARCPAIGDLFVPIAQCGAVRRELNMDLGRQVRGKTGKYVTLYKEVQKWLATQPQKQETKPPTGVKIHHA
jgi:hypothetical protein